MRDAGFSEIEIQNEIAKLRAEYGLSNDSVENLPAVIGANEKHGPNKGVDGSGRKYEPGTYPTDRPGRDERNTSTNKEAVAEYDSLLEKNAERRCVATNVKGERCRRYAIPGGRTCKTHGGATRHIMEKARIRVEMASDRLMGKLIDIAYDDTRPAAVQLDAIKDSLNRAGLTKPAQVEIGPTKPFEQVFDDIGTYRVNDAGREDDSLSNYDSSSDSLGVDPTRETFGTDNDSPRTPPQPRSDKPPKPRNYRGAQPITGDNAIRLANQANGVQRALPPGRSTR